MDDLIRCCEYFGSDFYLLRGLAARTQFLEYLGQRQAATKDLLRALTLAAPDGITMPFRLARGLLPLIHAAQKKAREDGLDATVQRFIATCLAALQGSNAPPETNVFSPREIDVLIQLVCGQTNKEIARTLDLTEHTIKFHLRNIFSKLGVENRTSAIIASKDLEIFSKTSQTNNFITSS